MGDSVLQRCTVTNGSFIYFGISMCAEVGVCAKTNGLIRNLLGYSWRDLGAERKLCLYCARLRRLYVRPVCWLYF